MAWALRILCVLLAVAPLRAEARWYGCAAQLAQMAAALVPWPTVRKSRIPEQAAELAKTVDHARVFADLSASDAAKLADDLQARLEVVLAKLQAMETPDTVVLEKLLQEFADGAFVEGTGVRIDSNPPPFGKNEIPGWVRTDVQFSTASIYLAARAKFQPGVIRPPEFVQRVDGIAGFPIVGDGNDPRLFVEQTLLWVEEHGHLVEALRVYAGRQGTAVNLSAWARDSGVSYTVEREADVYAWIKAHCPRWVGPHWLRNYDSRTLVP